MQWFVSVRAMLDDNDLGRIGAGQERVFDIAAGEHRLWLKHFGWLRRSSELAFGVPEGGERAFRYHINIFGYVVLRPASTEDAGHVWRPNDELITPDWDDWS